MSQLSEIVLMEEEAWELSSFAENLGLLLHLCSSREPMEEEAAVRQTAPTMTPLLTPVPTAAPRMEMSFQISKEKER